ncbi:MAG: ABC transporter permease [Hyphomicrobiaceae bacterium]
MSVLDRKLLRDLRRMWAQALAIALVIASGVATYVLADGAYQSLEATRSAYYERYRFADVFCDVRRAPKAALDQIAGIDGVAAVEARITHLALMDVEGLAEPASAMAVSLPDSGEPGVNLLHLREGRLPERGRADEVTINEGFAKAHDMRVGGTITVLLNGKKRVVKVVGVALSPEFIYALGPGDLMPDDRRFAVLWMSEKALAGLFDLDGAFNSVTLKLLPGASQTHVIKTLDDLLGRYGGTAAYGRADQLSHAFLDAELRQLNALRRVMPPIFLLVSAFLLNMTLSRMIALEREQIGLLKALGYPTATIAGHYLKVILAITAVGVMIGFIAGAWLGEGLTRLYGEFFHFPFLLFRHDPQTYAFAALVSVLAAGAGAAKAVREILVLAPAVAMQAPAPTRYRQFFTGGAHLAVMSQLTIMALRHMVRRPFRAIATSFGIAMAVGLLITALLSFDSVEQMIEVAFFKTDRQQATVAFTDHKDPRALQSVAHLPGVLRAEAYRSVSVRLRHEQRARQLSIVGRSSDMDLSRILDCDHRPIPLPPHGLVINSHVAKLLKVGKGDMLDLEILDGRRGSRRVVVAEIANSYFGLTAFMDLEALNRLMYDAQLTGVHISYDSLDETRLFSAIKSTPGIGSIALQPQALRRFRETIAQNINYSVTIYVALAVIIAFGVAYNSARIQFSEHARELASLRVLGFSRSEVSRVLLTEFVLLTLIAIPLGWAIGYGFGWLLIQAFSSDLYRVPFAIERATYAKASLVVLAATAASALLVRRRINRLDLIAVLKTRD